MKTITFILAMVVASSSFGQTKGEMPFTTTSPDANKFLRQALVAYGEANIDEGNKLVKESLAKDPDFGMAHMLSYSNDPEQRRQNVARAEGLKLSPDEKTFLNGLKARLDNKPTMEFFGPVLTKYPKDDYLHLIAILNSDTKTRIEIGEGLVKRSPKFAPGYNMLGYAYMDQNDMAKAESNLNKYMSLRPDLANVYDSKGDYMMRAGNFKEAVPLFEKAKSMGMATAGVKARRAAVRMKNPNLSDKDVEEIKKVIASCVEAIKKGDLEGYMANQADQAIEVFVSQMSNIGAANIRPRLKDAFKNGSFPKYDVAIKSVEGLGPVALAWGNAEWSYKTNATGQTDEVKRNLVYIFRKQENGSWRMLAYTATGGLDESPDDVANIRKVFGLWTASAKPGDVLEEKNLEAFLALYSPQAIEIFTNGRSNVGLGNIRARVSGFMGAKVDSNSLGVIGVEAMGRRGVAWGVAVQGTYDKAQKLNNAEFIWVSILTKEKDDQWRILVFHDAGS